MKTVIPITLLLVVFTSAVKAQNQDSFRKTHYGIEINQFITGSGFSSGTEAYFTVIPDNRKQISLGLYFCSELKKITGITVHHERSLIRMRDGKTPFMTPYAFYNLIYRKTTMREVLEDEKTTGDLVAYKSMEHHLGIGARFKLGSRIFIKSEAGYGVYLGSIKKPSAPNSFTGEISGTNGFCAIAKIGISYNF